MNGPVSDRLAAALAEAEQGRPVFFLGRSKRPVRNCRPCHTAGPEHDREACPCLTCHGFYAATCDPERIRTMHAAVPGGLLALRTGAPSGLVAIDIDPRNDGRLDPVLMTPTKAVATGDDGWHLYYRHPGGTILTRKMPGRPGIDVKADGGYVVAPPSIHPRTRRPYRHVGDRPVTEMRRALIEVIRSVAGPAVPAHHPTLHETGGRISSPAALLEANLAAVAAAPEGKRRNTLYGAARGLARMVAEQALTTAEAFEALYAAGIAAGQSPRDIRAAITGGFHAEGIRL